MLFYGCGKHPVRPENALDIRSCPICAGEKQKMNGEPDICKYCWGNLSDPSVAGHAPSCPVRQPTFVPPVHVNISPFVKAMDKVAEETVVERDRNIKREILKDGRKPLFTVKDSGQRQEYASGMVRDLQDGKVEYDRPMDGPMFDRWAEHLTKAMAKYPDDSDGQPNWMRANSPTELKRFRKSAVRHFRQWLRGDVDEDHAAAVYFNINGVEYVKARLKERDRNVEDVA